MAPGDRPEPPPEMPQWAEAPWRAWNDLSGERPHQVTGMAVAMGITQIASLPQAITWSALQAWCDRASLSLDDREDFVLPIVRALDAEYLAHLAAERRMAAGAKPDDKIARWDAMED
jgi:hypothetical protein